MHPSNPPHKQALQHRQFWPWALMCCCCNCLCALEECNRHGQKTVSFVYLIKLLMYEEYVSDQQICCKIVNNSLLPRRTEGADSCLWNYSHIVNHSVFTLSGNWQSTAMHTWYSDAFNIYCGTKMWPLQGILLGVAREGLHGIHQGWNEDSSGPESRFILNPWSCVWISVSKKRGPLNIKKDQHQWLSGHTPASVGSLNT